MAFNYSEFVKMIECDHINYYHMIQKCTKNMNCLITITYIWTFMGYANLHISRLLWSLSKPHLSDVISQQNQAYIDTAFLFVYALCLFFCGFISSKYSQSLFISIGMLGTSIIFALVYSNQIGISGYLKAPFILFILLFAFNGAFQSSGWPCNLAVVSNWIPKGISGSLLV